MTIKPEVKVFISALRVGKRSVQALEEYCWAKRVLPVREQDWQRLRENPSRCPVAWTESMADAMGADAFDEGASDAEIAEQFESGLAIDKDRGLLWRAMQKHEGPTQGDLIRAMSLDDQVVAAKFLGLRTIANAVADSPTPAPQPR